MMIATKAIECIHDETPCSTSYCVTKVINYATNPLPATFCMPCSLSNIHAHTHSDFHYLFLGSKADVLTMDEKKQQENMIIGQWLCGCCLNKMIGKKELFPKHPHSGTVF